MHTQNHDDNSSLFQVHLLLLAIFAFPFVNGPNSIRPTDVADPIQLWHGSFYVGCCRGIRANIVGFLYEDSCEWCADDVVLRRALLGLDDLPEEFDEYGDTDPDRWRDDSRHCLIFRRQSFPAFNISWSRVTTRMESNTNTCAQPVNH